MRHRIVLRLRRVRGSAAERKMFSARERTHDAIRIVTNASHREFVDKCDTPVGWCRDAIGDFPHRDPGELPPARQHIAALQWTWTVTHTCSTARESPVGRNHHCPARSRPSAVALRAPKVACRARRAPLPCAGRPDIVAPWGDRRPCTRRQRAGGLGCRSPCTVAVAVAALRAACRQDSSRPLRAAGRRHAGRRHRRQGHRCRRPT